MVNESDHPLLTVDNLSVHYSQANKPVKAVDEVSLELRKGETVGLAGESGCGKSTLGRSLLKLVPPAGKIVSGRVRFGDTSIFDLGDEELREVRGSRISMIFQDPAAYLNPTVKVGKQIAEVLRSHQSASRNEARKRAVHLLGNLGIPDPEQRFSSFPHEMSGGMKQRVIIAMALICNPSIVVADEPTTALDVTIQRQILELIKDQVIREDSALFFITHDLSLLAEICDRIYIMYAGAIIEQADAVDLFSRPSHPYTRGLLKTIPRHDEKRPMIGIDGSPPDLDSLPDGCRFQPRCQYRTDQCSQAEPPLRRIRNNHKVRCYHEQDRELD